MTPSPLQQLANGIDLADAATRALIRAESADVRAVEAARAVRGLEAALAVARGLAGK